MIVSAYWAVVIAVVKHSVLLKSQLWSRKGGATFIYTQLHLLGFLNR